MEKARLDGVELEYDVTGSGEPVLLISNGPFADGFLPFLTEQALVGHYRLITYRQRGQATGTHGAATASFVVHAADAAALLCHLGVRRAHIVGHSTGAVIGLQLALDHPELVHTLALLEPPLMGVPSAGAFLEKVGPAFVAYGAGDSAGALAAFLTFVSGRDWEKCQTLIEGNIPGGVGRAVKDADTLFGGYLPALGAWQFGADQAAQITQSVLSVRGTETEQLFVEGHELLDSWFPQLETCTIQGIAHLLQMERPAPVAEGIAEFLARHPLPGALDRATEIAGTHAVA